MADTPRSRDTGHPEPRTGMPRWLKMMVIVVSIVLLLVVAVMLVGGGGHGPSRHAAAGGDVGPSSAVALQHMSPERGHG